MSGYKVRTNQSWYRSEGSERTIYESLSLPFPPDPTSGITLGDTFQHVLIRLTLRVFHKRQTALGHSDTALPRGHVDVEQELSHILRPVASPADIGS